LTTPHPQRKTHHFHLLSWLFLLLFIGELGAAAWYEGKTSALQSRVLSEFAEKLVYSVEAGPSDKIAFPTEGPFNVKRGYNRIGEFQRRLEERGFTVVEQSRFSPELLAIAEKGIAPPYQEPPIVGLVIKDAAGKRIYDATSQMQSYRSYDDIPPLITKALLFIEDRNLEDPPDLRTNPVINWKRFIRAAVMYGAGKIGLPVNREGGSTLATQLQKFRYSGQGRTEGIGDKLRQITGASLKVYSEGSNTQAARKTIVVDYINLAPFAAVPGFGEIYGLAQALQAWFGLSLDDVNQVLSSKTDDEHKARIYKQVLMLLCSVRAPTYYLKRNPAALRKRVSAYINLMAANGIITRPFAEQLNAVSVSTNPTRFKAPQRTLATKKSVNALRSTLSRSLDVHNYYDLDRLYLEVDSTIDSTLQDKVTALFHKLHDPNFLAKHGLKGKRTLLFGDPGSVVYSFLLYESTPNGNFVRVTADSINQPFDINRSMKLDLGSTAKLRTVTHYLDIVSELYREYSPLSTQALPTRPPHFTDPITGWAIKTLNRNRTITLEQFLDKALARKYSASPYEQFYTAGGLQTFANFSKSDNRRRLTVREATYRSVNLPLIRLMRDLVRYHRARLPYDAKALIKNPKDRQRRKFLEEIADKESRKALWRYYKKYHRHESENAVALLLKKNDHSLRHLILLYYAWHPDADDGEVMAWLQERIGEYPYDKAFDLFDRYRKPRYDLVDYSYLLRKHPLEVWTANAFFQDPEIRWDTLLNKSTEARRLASSWLFKTRKEGARTIRLRTRIEQDAFARMTPYWQKLGYPFEVLPSYASAIGSSADRPAALAELMGILVNDGVRRPNTSITRLKLAEGTPYHTIFEPRKKPGEQVLAPEVARAVRSVATDVVRKGTARRVNGAFKNPDNSWITVGGKTGTGDNRAKRFNRWGNLISSRAVNRTATFTFFIGNRYFGVITAFVDGPKAEDYHFTSSLAVSILRLLAPTINAHIAARTEPLETASATRRLSENSDRSEGEHD